MVITKNRINIKNLSIYLPKKNSFNSKLDKKFGLKKNTLSKLTGIKRRKISSIYETSESMAIKVAKKLINKNKKKINITHLITVSNTPKIFFPSLGHYVYSKISQYIKSPPFIIPLNCGCSGYVDALIIANRIILSDKKSRVLIITSDTYSKFIKPLDKSILPLFGDGASASIIEYDKNGWIMEKEFSETIPNTEENLIFAETNGKRFISMKGPELINFAIKDILPKLIEFIKNEKNITLFSHQASKIVLNLLKKEVSNINMNFKFPTYYENIGNLVSTSIPVLIKKNQKLFNNSKKILIFGFGVGLTHSYIRLRK